jgi:3-hexulose-6-phosphate synthase/6-phospho-3-hexuloisomerase
MSSTYEVRTINPRPPVDESLIAPFRALHDVLSISCVVSDSMDRANTMDCGIVPRGANKKIIGPAVTVKLRPGDIVDCLDVFTIVKPGDVVVIDAFGERTTSIWGGLMSGIARNAGAIGAVIDGSCRDTDEARMLDFPLHARWVNPRAAHTASTQRKTPIEINVPIVCGGIAVTPGDLVVADEIGVVVVPYANLAAVYARAKDQADKEAAARQDVLNGMGVDELLKKYGRI